MALNFDTNLDTVLDVEVERIAGKRNQFTYEISQLEEKSMLAVTRSRKRELDAQIRGFRLRLQELDSSELKAYEAIVPELKKLAKSGIARELAINVSIAYHGSKTLILGPEGLQMHDCRLILGQPANTTHRVRFWGYAKAAMETGLRVNKIQRTYEHIISRSTYSD